MKTQCRARGEKKVEFIRGHGFVIRWFGTLLLSSEVINWWVHFPNNIR